VKRALIEWTLSWMACATWLEGQSITIDWRFPREGVSEGLAEVAADLVRLAVDLIVVEGSTPGAEAAKRATSTIPVLLTPEIVVVEHGFMRRPR
jgi:hypothetical protein